MNNHIILLLFMAIASSYYLGACGMRSKVEGTLNKTLLQQHFVQGQILYNTHCSNCHQKDGSGLKQLYPPLDTSDFMKKNIETAICIIKYGISGEIWVNKKSYNQDMPGAPQLTKQEVAKIATYIYNQGEHNHGLINTTYVDSVLNRCQ